jgi:hypothetical protein
MSGSPTPLPYFRPTAIGTPPSPGHSCIGAAVPGHALACPTLTSVPATGAGAPPEWLIPLGIALLLLGALVLAGLALSRAGRVQPL